MRRERLNNLPLNTVTPNFVAIFVLCGTASSFIEIISFSEIEAKREAILFLLGCLEVNSTCIITSGLANQRAPKALFTCVVYTKYIYIYKKRYVRYAPGSLNQHTIYIPMQFCTCNHTGPLAIMN